MNQRASFDRPRPIVAGTGHRPNKVGGYSLAAHAKLVLLASRELMILNPLFVISGMAQGWDTALAQAAIDRGIDLHAYIPFKGQEKVWPSEARETYRALLNRSTHIKTCCSGSYAVWKMQKRNEMMVDDCSLLLALWDGSKGGTDNCIRYAESVGRSWSNCWNQFQDMS